MVIWIVGLTCKRSRYVRVRIAIIRHNIVEYDDRIIRKRRCFRHVSIECHITLE